MRHWLRLGLRWGGRGLVVGIVAAIAFGVWYAYAVQPQVSGTLRLAGLTAPVDVVRDREGVPHIYAATEADAHFAQGFVTAQDRLWQMDFQRRIANGRVAEILGAPGLDIDVMVRILGIRRTAEAMWARYSPAERAPFDAYARGVNAYLATRNGPLPPEFWLTGAPSPEPWTATDSIGWMLMLSWDLGTNWRSELVRVLLLQQGLSITQINQFLPAYPGEPYPDVGDVAQRLKPLFAQMRSDLRATETRLSALPIHVEGLGSNNWVVAGSRSTTGKPLLANDPHLGLTVPSVWYLAHLASRDGLDVIGATLPGIPGVLIGHNQRIAWGVTNTGSDVEDLFIEKINPDNAQQYLTPEGWRDFETVRERIRVKGGADRVIDVRSSRHGPVVSDLKTASLRRVTPQGHVLALAWTALSADNRTPLAMAPSNRAHTWDEFVESVRMFSAPQLNFVYADVDGNIGFIAPGRVPIRKPENDLKGLYPQPGWDAKYDWAGFVPFEELPREFNPASGFRATANHKVTAQGYKYPLSYEWSPPFRFKRIAQLIEARPLHSLDSFAAMQADVVSLPMAEVLPYLLQAPTAGAKEQAAHDLLGRWNATMASGRVEPLIASAWLRQLSVLIPAEVLGPTLAPALLDIRMQFMLDVLADRGGAGRWCARSDETVGTGSNCNALIARALTLALADLERRYGSNMAQWTWGPAHAAHSAHRPFGSVPGLAGLFDIRVATGGDTYTIDVGRNNIADPREPFAATLGPSFRMLCDLADLERSRFMQSTGQSGIPFSPFYANFAARWAKVEYIPMRTQRAAAEEGATGTLHLTP